MAANTSKGYVNISKRISLRWLPDPPSEPTDTIVFTVGTSYVDLRVKKCDGTIDWAFAGTREILSKEPRTRPPSSAARSKSKRKR
jgi:hypothetical protein